MLQKRQTLRIAILCIFLIFLWVPTTDAGPPCLVAVLCSTQPDPVWATDGRTCQEFNNSCYLLQENCSRQNSDSTRKWKRKYILNFKCDKISKLLFSVNTSAEGSVSKLILTREFFCIGCDSLATIVGKNILNIIVAKKMNERKE